MKSQNRGHKEKKKVALPRIPLYGKRRTKLTDKEKRNKKYCFRVIPRNTYNLTPTKLLGYSTSRKRQVASDLALS